MDSLVARSGRSVADSTDKRVPERSFATDDPVEFQQAFDSVEQFLMVPQLVAETQPGSQVHIVDKSDRRFMGTLLNSTPDSVELMNCLCREVVPAPGGQQQCKTSHVPFQSLSISTMTHFVVVSPPPAEFAVPDQDLDTRDVTIQEIVFRSGRRQRWGNASESTK